MRSIPQIIHDMIKAALPSYSQILTHFQSGTGNTVCFVREKDGQLWRVRIETWPPPGE